MARIISSLALLLFVAGCATKLDVEKIPLTENPSAQVEKLDKEIAQAKNDKVNMLSPDWFNDAEESLKDAKKILQKEGSVKDIFTNLEEGYAQLKRARTYAEVARTVLKPSIDQREDALQLGGPTLGKEWQETEWAFVDNARNIESNDLKGAEAEQPKLLKAYRQLGTKATQNRYLATARQNLEKAKKEDSKKFAPNATKAAEESLRTAESGIAADPHNEANNKTLSANAIKATDHLLTLTEESKKFAKTHPEQTAMELEGRVSQLNQDQMKIRDLEKTEKFNQGYSEVSAMFSNEEAEVSREGDKLVIRMRGVTFPSGKAEISPNNYALLGKLQQAVQRFPDSHIVVEGHTDATGTKEVNQKLSQERAEAVKSYMVENFKVTPDQVEAEGFGFERPLTHNKTAAARALNRRIDVIIEPPTSSPSLAE